MGRNRYFIGIIFAFIFLINAGIMVGCWDQTEIEDLAIVVGVAIDKPKTAEGKEEEKKESERNLSYEKHRLTVTQQFVVSQAMGSKESSAGMPSQEAYSNVASEGNTLFQIASQFSTMSSRLPYYKHLKAIIISEEIAKSLNLEQLLNFFLREPEMTRDIQVMIYKGCARDVLEVKPIKERLPVLALLSLTENEKKTARMAEKLMLGNMSKKMANGSSFLIPRVVTYGDSVQLAGAAVIKGKENTMIGWLGEEETEAINWILGKIEGSVVETVDKETKEFLVYEVKEQRSQIKPKVEGEKISFVVEIESEGGLGEDWLISGDAFEEAFMQRATEAIREEIVSIIYDGLTKTQKEFKVDVAGFGKQLYVQYPEVWEKVKENWDEYFSTVPVEVNVEIHVREFGMKGSKSMQHE